MRQRSLARRLAALEQATTPRDESLMITIAVYDETPDRIIRTVTVPMGTPDGEMDYRKAGWMLYPGDDAERADGCECGG